MPTAKIWINKAEPRADGTCTIYIIVYFADRSQKINTAVTAEPQRWDDEKKRIRGTSKAVTDGNLIIAQYMARVNDIFVRYRLQNAELTPELFRNEWKNPARRIDFHAFFAEALDERKKELSAGSYRHHKSFGKILAEYRPKIAFAEITPDFIEQFQRWLRARRHNDVNTVHGKMRVFRTYLNIAVRKGIITENPFSVVKLKKKQVNRVFLSAGELKTLWGLYRSGSISEKHRRTLRYFLFMCLTGLRVSDLRAMQHTNIMDAMLVFQVHKTRNTKQNMVKIPLTKQATQLIADEGTTSGPLFKAMSDQKLNVYIKEVCAIAGINKEVTNHSGRHTFAFMWLDSTNDLAQLQVLLGHSNITETMVYVHISEAGLKSQMAVFESKIMK